MSSPSLMLKAPFDGIVVLLADVPDPAFAEGILGEGIALDPLGDTLHAPCDGEVVQCARAKHAVTLRTDMGIEVLLHLGLDTVNLDGQGIELLVEVGSRVESGAPLCRFDADRLARGATALITPLIVTDGAGWQVRPLTALASGSRVRCGEPLLRLEAAEAAPSATTDATGSAQERALTLALGGGLHARPAARLRAIAQRHEVTLTVVAEENEADSASLSALMNLGLAHGSSLTLMARGAHAELALDEAEALLTTPEAEEHGQEAPSESLPTAGEGQLPGLVASPGLALGPLVPYRAALPEVPVDGEGDAVERLRLRQALVRVGESLQASMHRAERDGQAAEAEIFAAHQAWLEDPDLQAAAGVRLAAGRSAGHAWREALDAEADRLLATGNALLMGRVADLRDLQCRVMAELADPQGKPGLDLPAGAIVIAEDLTPSELVTIASRQPAGLCLAAGGTTSHVAILARARGIPCLVAMGERVLRMASSDRAVLDAEQGLLEPTPDAERLAAVEANIRDNARRAAEEREAAQAPATTVDGRDVEVGANVGSAAEARLAAEQGADGIGLMRSEFLFLERRSAPDEEDQRCEYQAAVEALGGKPVIIRTLDIGADKQLPYLMLPQVPNPALGVRGVRLWQRHPDLLDSQLRALLRVEPLETLRIMVPMVSDASELHWVRGRMQSLAKEQGLTILPRLGAMIEVPSAALCAASLAEEADFLSIGTNDLTQYVLAMDREDPHLAARADVLHPGVLHLIQATVTGAAGKCPVGVCGAAAGDPLAALVLVALGVDELSVEPARIPAIKAAIRRLDARTLADELPALLRLADAMAVREHLAAWQQASQDTTTTNLERMPS
ncbi:phosphoenolpyruvate--protein phosphotransferase [Litchfieldella rifensis]|uniref:phosphoenolpyruvate--protein phosphotransferase n=1 Tax=Litchfieldella rifensis TaxID=762643 RepID=A0ABV7LJP1_9GAMM